MPRKIDLASVRKIDEGRFGLEQVKEQFWNFWLSES